MIKKMVALMRSISAVYVMPFDAMVRDIVIFETASEMIFFLSVGKVPAVKSKE